MVTASDGENLHAVYQMTGRVGVDALARFRFPAYTTPYNHQNIPPWGGVTATYGFLHTWRRGVPDSPVRVGVDALARFRFPARTTSYNHQN